MIKVRYFGNLAQRTELKEETYDVKNVNELLKEIKTKYGEEIFKIAKTSHIIINEENAAFKGGFKAKLIEGDTVKFLPICGGG